MNTLTKFNLTVIFLFSLVLFSDCAKKIWQYTTDIQDSRNWVVVEDQDNCHGLIFPEYIYGSPQLSNFSAKQIVLPKEGTLRLPNNIAVGLNENSEEKINCVIINSTNLSQREWAFLDAWITEGVPEVNPAMPDMERLPCQFDDVLFPKGLLTSPISLYNYGERVKVKSFTFGTEKWSNDDLFENGKLEIFQSIFGGNTLERVIVIKGKECTDPTGCICGNELANQIVCWYVSPPANLTCLDPVQPKGFCRFMCGAYIQFKSMKNIFKIDSIEDALKDYQSYSHVSKVALDTSEYIQIVFTEKEFSGTSAEDAQHLYQRLLSENSFGAKKITITVSRVKRYYGTSTSIIFGTFLAVAAMFGLLFLIFTPKYQEFIRENIANRLNLNFSTSRSDFGSAFMAKYRKPDNNPSVDTQSIAESVVSLEKSFENPLYGQVEPSTSSASFDKNISKEERAINSESDSKKTMFDVKRFEELRDISENGELVDLTEN